MNPPVKLKTENKILAVLKKVLLIITSPIWFPWKLLFVRKPGQKFSEVSDKEKTFRLLRSPITKPLKLLVYLFIILVEVLVVYKVRFSPLTFPLTRNSVRDHYLTPNELIEEHPITADELTTAFEYIDTWDLDTKNKMYVIFDASIVKWAFRYASYDTTTYILHKFNTDEVFRNDIHYIVENINSIFSRAIRELPSELSADEFDFILNPLATIGSTVTDYRAVLDLTGPMGTTATEKYNLREHGTNFAPTDINKTLAMIIDFSKGTSLSAALDAAYNRH